MGILLSFFAHCNSSQVRRVAWNMSWRRTDKDVYALVDEEKNMQEFNTIVLQREVNGEAINEAN
jgi:hypothetical protein